MAAQQILQRRVIGAARRLYRYLPEGVGLGASRPDSINVGRIGPIPSMFVPRDLEG